MGHKVQFSNSSFKEDSTSVRRQFDFQQSVKDLANTSGLYLHREGAKLVDFSVKEANSAILSTWVEKNRGTGKVRRVSLSEVIVSKPVILRDAALNKLGREVYTLGTRLQDFSLK